MLFGFGDDIFESEKERNLYYKFFAGYFFNELLPGWQHRLKSFQSILRKATKRNKGCGIPGDKILLSSKSTHVSFDNHIYLLDEDFDRGEFADILVHDPKNKTFVCIEVKYLSDWNFEKDIKRIKNRLDRISYKLKDTVFTQCILMKKCKWEELGKKNEQKGSNYKRWEKLGKERPLILFWEDFLPFCENTSQVSNFLEYLLNLSPPIRFKVADRGFKRFMS